MARDPTNERHIPVLRLHILTCSGIGRHFTAANDVAKRWNW